MFGRLFKQWGNHAGHKGPTCVYTILLFLLNIATKPISNIAKAFEAQACRFDPSVFSSGTHALGCFSLHRGMTLCRNVLLSNICLYLISHVAYALKMGKCVL